MNNQDIEKSDIDARNFLDQAWNSQRIQIISRKNRWINKISMTKYKSDDFMNKSVDFAFKNTFELNMILKRHIHLMIKNCKMMNFVIIYDS